jgi:hypothetical protein
MNVPSIFVSAETRGGAMPAGPDDDSWAVTECTDAELGDARRTQRLVELATILAQRPGASLPEACGDRALLKAGVSLL